MATPEGQNEVAIEPEEPRGDLAWRKLASWAAFAIPILFILMMIIFMEFIPFFIPFIVIFAGVGWWVGRGGRASAIVLAVLAILFIAMNAPFIIPTLSVPASVVDFIPTAFILLAAVTAVVAGFAAFRSDSPSGGPRTFARVVMAIAALAVVVSVISFVTYDDASQQEGDIELTAEEISFEPDDLEGESGKVSVLVRNNDPTLHTFTIDELDVHLDIPADATARIEFDADPGEYEFYCAPHEADMKGTLTVK